MKFTTPLSSVTVFEKDEAVLECEVSEENVSVQWYHNDQAFPLGNRVIATSFGKKHILTFPWTSMSDTGRYSITARFAKSSTTLNIKGNNINFKKFFIWKI